MQELINKKFQELTENGKLDEIVTKQVTDFINTTIRDSLSSYGDASKAFKDRLNKSLIEGFDELDFIQYSKSLTDLVENELNKSIIEFALEPTKQMIKSFIGNLDKKNWKLSEIIEEFKKSIIPDEYGESGEIAFLHETSSYGSVHIGFDEDSNNHLYQCKYRLLVDSKTNKLYSPTIDGKYIHPLTEMGLYGFDLFLFKLYAMGCIIDCDFDNVETEWSTYE